MLARFGLSLLEPLLLFKREVDSRKLVTLELFGGNGMLLRPGTMTESPGRISHRTLVLFIDAPQSVFAPTLTSQNKQLVFHSVGLIGSKTELCHQYNNLSGHLGLKKEDFYDRKFASNAKNML